MLKRDSEGTAKFVIFIAICLFQRKLGFTNLTGVDYSDLAVMLAKSVAKSEGYEDINFEVNISCFKGSIA